MDLFSHILLKNYFPKVTKTKISPIISAHHKILQIASLTWQWIPTGINQQINNLEEFLKTLNSGGNGKYTQFFSLNILTV